MKIGQRLQDLRQKNGASQEMVASKIHVSRQTISNWENEHSIPDLQSLLLLADLYSTTLDELVRGDLDMLDAKKVIKQMVWYTFGLLVSVIFVYLGFYLLTFGKYWSVAAYLAGFALFAYFTYKFFKLQKQKNVWTIAEIRYYMKTGKIRKSRNRKRKVLLESLFGALLGAIIGVVLMFILLHFMQF